MDGMDEKVLDFVEDKLNDLVDETCDKFNKSVAAEIAMSCAGLSAQMSIAGDVSKEDFMKLMEHVYIIFTKDRNNSLN